MRASDRLPAPLQTLIYPHVLRLVQGTIHQDPAAWVATYVPTPLDFIQTPASPFYPALAELVDIQLSQWLSYAQQHDVWTPTWTWGQYDDEWPTAQAWWSGKMTVERLIILARFQRLAQYEH